MKTETSSKAAEILFSLIRDAGYDPRTDYSGRGMYGAHCLAVEIPADKFGFFMADLLEEARRNGQHAIALDAIRYHRTDNAGHDVVVYFPRHETSKAAA